MEKTDKKVIRGNATYDEYRRKLKKCIKDIAAGNK